MLVDYASGAVSQVCAQPHSLQTPFCAHMNPLTTLATSHATPRVLAAIDPRACSRDPSACAAVQRVLERDPTLTWINGRFVPAHELRPPSPPPPPTPPPLLELYTRPAPLPFPPAPSPPPPWYQHAETCVPITTAAENNIDVGDGLERAVCVYVRAIADERVRATKCFEQMAPSPPPPPPVPRSRAALLLAKLVKIKDRSGQSNGPAPRPLDTNEEAYQNQHDAQTAAQLHLLDSLAEDNFQLRTLLGDVRNRISSFGGRRLWERSNVRNSHLFIENVLATEAFGNAPLVNVTIAECQALCHAIDNTTLGTCRAIAFARNTPNPRDLTLRQCYLLKQTGGCSGSTFAGAVFSRRDTDACVEPTEQENPLCIQLSNTRTDLVRKRLAFELHPTFPVPFPDVALFPSQRVLDFAAATTACRQGRGRPELAWPKTTLEVCHVFPTPDHAPCRRIPTPRSILGGRRLVCLGTRAKGASAPFGPTSPTREAPWPGPASTANRWSSRRATSAASWCPPWTPASTASCTPSSSPARPTWRMAWSASRPWRTRLRLRAALPRRSARRPLHLPLASQRP